MNNPRHDQKLREQSWRRPLTGAELSELRALLKENPAESFDLEAELALTMGLNHLPDVELSSNFTARVVQEAERKRAADRRRRWSWRRVWGARWRLLPKVAFTGFLISASTFTYWRVQQVERARMMESVATVSHVAALPGPELLSDFDAIHALAPAPGADEELLRLLQ